MSKVFRIYEVTPNLAFGSAIKDKADVAILTKAKYTHIINCQENNKDGKILHKDFVYLDNAIEDDGKEKPTWWFRRAINLFHKSQKQTDAKIFIHCSNGKVRSPALVYAILLEQGNTPEEAEALIRSARNSVSGLYFPSAVKALKQLNLVGNESAEI